MELGITAVLASVFGALIGSVSAHRYQRQLERTRLRADAYAAAVEGIFAVMVGLEAYFEQLADFADSPDKRPAETWNELSGRLYSDIAVAAHRVSAARARIRLLGTQEVFDAVHEVLLLHLDPLDVAPADVLEGGPTAAREHVESFLASHEERFKARNDLVGMCHKIVMGRRSEGVIVDDEPPLLSLRERSS